MSNPVPRSLAGERIDRYVSMATGVSRAAAAGLVGEGAVRIDGEVCTVRSTRLAEGQEVTIDRLPEPEPPAVADPGVAVPVVHADEHVVVVDKPAGLVVHPGAGHRQGTLVHGLLARFPELDGVGQADRPGIVHRLDAGTSGLLVVARSAAAYDGLVAQLSAHTVDRRYQALVWGHPDGPSGRIDAPVGRSGRVPTRMAVSTRGRQARTDYEVRRTFDDPAATALLTCTLETGRTHQIRVHLAAIGHPVVGDVDYGGVRAGPPSIDRPFLHAGHLAFTHPLTGDRLAFDSALPSDLDAILGTLA